LALAATVLGACVIDEHVSGPGLVVLEQVASALDRDESPEAAAELRATCEAVDAWVANGDAGRDGTLISRVCGTALAEGHWREAHDMMLGLFPRAARQRHL
jgi:hypothetical protein